MSSLLILTLVREGLLLSVQYLVAKEKNFPLLERPAKKLCLLFKEMPASLAHTVREWS